MVMDSEVGLPQASCVGWCAFLWFALIFLWQYSLATKQTIIAVHGVEDWCFSFSCRNDFCRSGVWFGMGQGKRIYRPFTIMGHCAQPDRDDWTGWECVVAVLDRWGMNSDHRITVCSNRMWKAIALTHLNDRRAMPQQTAPQQTYTVPWSRGQVMTYHLAQKSRSSTSGLVGSDFYPKSTVSTSATILWHGCMTHSRLWHLQWKPCISW